MTAFSADATDASGEHLLAVLRGHRRRWRLLLLCRGLLEGIGLSCVLFVLLFAVWGRYPAFAIIPCMLAVAIPTMLRLLSPLTDQHTALAIERTFPFIQDRVATGLDLARRGDRPASSEAMTRRVFSEATGALRSLPLSRALPLASLRPAAALAVGGLALMASAWLLIPVAADDAGTSPPVPAARPSLTHVAEAVRPRLYDVSISIAPPAYSGLPAYQRELQRGTVRALMGSRVTIAASMEPASMASAIAVSGRAELSMATIADGRSAVSFVLSERIEGRVVAHSGEQKTAGPMFTIEPTIDAQPSVRLVRPSGDLTLEAPVSLEVAAAASDDFLITALGLRYRLEGDRNWQSLRLPAQAGSSVGSSARLNLQSLGVRPGKSLQLRAWATDNDAFGGPKTSVSRVITIKVRGEARPEPGETPLEEAHEDREDAFERMQREAARFEDALTDTLEQLQAGGQGSAAEMGARLQEAAQRLQQQAGMVEAAMREVEQQLATDSLVPPELLEKVQELHELMREAMNDELRQALDELEAALTEADPESMRMSLEEVRDAQRRFMDRLDQTLDLLRRARLEAELSQLRGKVEDLAKRQKELADQARSMGDGRDAASRRAEQEQRRLARDTEPLAEDVIAAAEKTRELSDDIARDLDALTSEIMRRDPQGDMREAAGALGRGKPSAADQPQQRALQTLRDVADRLAEAEDGLTGDMRAELMRAASETLRDTLYLSRGQEELMVDTRHLAEGAAQDLLRDKPRVQPLSRRQGALAGSVERLAERMDELARSTPVMDPSLSRDVAAIAHDMRQAAREIDGAELGPASSRQQESVARLNDAAERLLELSEALSQASAQSTLSEYMQRLSELAERQRQLNQQTGGASEGERQPGSQPGMGLPQLAYEQAMIRAALEQMMRGAGGESEQVADQLGGVPDEMGKVEGDLRDGRVGRETLQRQGQILQKMLDAQRSLYARDEERSERRAEQPKAFEPPPSPPVLSPSLMRAPEVRLSSPGAGGRLPAGFEDLVEAYYMRLGREARQ